MGAVAAKEIVPLVPMVLNALPALIQGFQSTRNNSEEDKKIDAVLQRLQSDRHDIDQVIQNQAQLTRTYEGLTLLMNRLENGDQGNMLINGDNPRGGANHGNAHGGPKIRIEMDLPENAEDRDEAVRNFWLTLGRVANGYSQQEQMRLANEPRLQGGDLNHRRENLLGAASAPAICSNEALNPKATATPDHIDRILSCEICTQEYNTEERRPTLLPLCGHTFCKECLHRTRRQSHLCPTCRKECDVEVDQLPTNYSILDFMNEEKDEDLKKISKPKKKSSKDDNCDLSFDDQLRVAIQLSLEDNHQDNHEDQDFLFAKRLQEEEERLMRFRQHEDKSVKGRSCWDEDEEDGRETDSDEELGNCRRENPHRNMNADAYTEREGENRGARRKGSHSPKHVSYDDDDCHRLPTSEDSYAEARQMLNKLDNFHDKCMDTCSNFSKREEGRDDSDAEAEGESLYEREKESMKARANMTYEEEKARKKQSKMLKEQEDLDTAIAISISEMAERQDD